MPALYRFTRDLRLEDHAGLAAAAAHGEVIPILIVDRRLTARLAASARRAAFYCGCVTALERSLRERGASLIVRRGEPEALLPGLAQVTGATTIVWSASYDEESAAHDHTLQATLEEAGLRALPVHDAPAIPPEETTAARPSAGEGYRAFAPYYETWRELHSPSFEAPLLLSFARSDLPSEPLPQPAEFNSPHDPPECGAAAAKGRLDAFLRSGAPHYAISLNVPADNSTSHLSADLTFGTIAARTIVRETRRRIEDPFLLVEERSSLRLFLRSIAMRDFFLQLSWYNPQTSREPLQEKMRSFEFASTHPALDAWRGGRTGYSLVDSGMRQLHGTGWMHPHVRSIAASFLCFDLGVDWRVGLAEWERYLIEDDPALAVGNWQWIAGVGADLAAYPRIYNPITQARRFDPDGAYARQWIPELAHVAAGALRAAQRREQQIELTLYAGERYPPPVVDHESSARAFLTRYQKYAGAQREG